MLLPSINVLLIEADEDPRSYAQVRGARTRPGAPHANQPHTFLGGTRSILRRRMPSVLDGLLGQGGREVREPPTPPPGLEDLLSDSEYGECVAIACRRQLLEGALLDYALQRPQLTVRWGARTDGLQIAKKRGTPSVTGVRLGGDFISAPTVVDAMGERSPFSCWLEEHEIAGPLNATVSAYLFYAAKAYELGNLAENEVRGRSSLHCQPLSDAIFDQIIFFHDPPFASLVLLAWATPSAAELSDWVRSIEEDNPTASCFLSREGASAASRTRAIKCLKNRLSLYGSNAYPPVKGLHRIGDSLMSLNPITSVGASLAFIEAEIVADAVIRHP